MALRAKIRPDYPGPQGQVFVLGVETRPSPRMVAIPLSSGENTVCLDFHPSNMDPSLGTPDLRRNPKGRGQFS